MFLFFFFFSSRRRHTRLQGDWSSDVCSSDLGLRWDKSVDPLAWQPRSTIYERAAEAGINTYRVAAATLEKTGLSTAVMRGNCYRPADSLGALAAEAADALRWSDRALVTVYHAQLDG